MYTLKPVPTLTLSASLKCSSDSGSKSLDPIDARFPAPANSALDMPCRFTPHAASVHTAARSAPEYPSDRAVMTSRSASGMELFSPRRAVITRARRDSASGRGTAG